MANTSKVRALGICGSPRQGGNSDVLLDAALEGAASAGASVEKVSLNDLKFSPCQECAVMRDDGICSIEDDMQELYPKITRADIVILSAPIFFGSLSAQTKMMIDRFQCLWRAKYQLKSVKSGKGKKGAFICVEASNREDFLNNARSIVKNLFATIGVKYEEELFCQGVDKKGSILKRPEEVKKAFVLGKKLAKN